MNWANVLSERLAAVKDNRSDVEVFKHIHAYIKYLLTTPELKAVIDIEEKDFYNKLQYTKDNIKFEDANFHQSYFLPSYIRIYLPIENYQNSFEPDEEQDPIALLLLYGPKHPRTQKWVNRFPMRDIRKERVKQINSYWKWFDGRTQEYVDDINNLHLEIITALSQQNTSEDSKTESGSEFELNLETGEFQYGQIVGSFNTKSQPFRVISTLHKADGKTVPYLELIRCLKPNADKTTKPDKAALSTIIRNLKIELGILSTKQPNKDIFHNEKRVGYRLKIQD